jgi:hypothetical protein
VLDVVEFEHRDVPCLADLALDDRRLRASQSVRHDNPVPGNYCIWSSMVENAAFSFRAFLISVALTYGYSAYSRKLGH